MPRKPRIEFKGALYHIINRGNNRQTIFFNRSDYKEFLNCLKLVQQRCPFILYGYVLMLNHFHLIIETINDPISRIMRVLLTRYAKFYNFKHKRIGHVFQGRYRAILCQKDRYLLELVRYIHLNPLRANLVKDISEWEWSSHPTYLGGKNEIQLNIPEVLSYFGNDANLSQRKYLEFIKEGYEDKSFNPYPKEIFPYLGDGKFIDEVSKKFVELRRQTVPEIRMTLEDLAEGISKIFEIEIQRLKCPSKERKISEIRSTFCYLANRVCSHKIGDIAKFLNLSLPAISRAITRAQVADKKIQNIIKLLKVNK